MYAWLQSFSTPRAPFYQFFRNTLDAYPKVDRSAAFIKGLGQTFQNVHKVFARAAQDFTALQRPNYRVAFLSEHDKVCSFVQVSHVVCVCPPPPL